MGLKQSVRSVTVTWCINRRKLNSMVQKTDLQTQLEQARFLPWVRARFDGPYTSSAALSAFSLFRTFLYCLNERAGIR